ncbi:hypothetical protein JCM16816_03450 [Thermoanaerobacter brockii subsp. lactiethylicus]
MDERKVSNVTIKKIANVSDLLDIEDICYEFRECVGSLSFIKR